MVQPFTTDSFSLGVDHECFLFVGKMTVTCLSCCRVLEVVASLWCVQSFTVAQGLSAPHVVDVERRPETAASTLYNAVDVEQGPETAASSAVGGQRQQHHLERASCAHCLHTGS